MKSSKHASTRQKQRGISDFIKSIIEQYGTYENAPGGAMRIFMGKREYQNMVGEIKWVLQQLDKARNGTIVFKDNTVLTVYK